MLVVVALLLRLAVLAAAVLGQVLAWVARAEMEALMVRAVALVVTVVQAALAHKVLLLFAMRAQQKVLVDQLVPLAATLTIRLPVTARLQHKE
jgi:hypothetical protein